MNILIQSYSLAFQNPAGGVKVRIKMFDRYLRKHGIDVECFNPFATDMKKCDILHVFGFNFENLTLIRYAKSLGKKIVISPIIPTSRSWRAKAYRLFTKLPLATIYKYLYTSIRMADLIIVETTREKEFIRKNFKIVDEKIKIIPNGAEPCLKKDDLIFETLGIPRCKFVLHVGRFDKNKNQLSLIRAMKGTDIPVVFIGGQGIEDENYYNKCIAEAKGRNNFHFLGWLDVDSPVLKSAYANCDTFVLPSFYETFGISLIEAGVSGAKLVISKTLPILESGVFDSCITFDPYDTDQIRSSVLQTIANPKDEIFAEKMRELFSWDSVAGKHINFYKELLK